MPDSRGQEGLRSLAKRTSWGLVGRKGAAGKNQRAGRGQKGARGRADRKEAGSQKRRGDGGEGRRAMHPLPPPPSLAASLSRHSSERTDWVSGEQGGPEDRQEPRSLRRARCYLVASRSCLVGAPRGWGRDREGPEADFPREPHLGHRVRGSEMAVEGDRGRRVGGDSPPPPTVGLGCGSGSRTPGRLRSHASP